MKAPNITNVLNARRHTAGSIMPQSHLRAKLSETQLNADGKSMTDLQNDDIQISGSIRVS